MFSVDALQGKNIPLAHAVQTSHDAGNIFPFTRIFFAVVC